MDKEERDELKSWCIVKLKELAMYGGKSSGVRLDAVRELIYLVQQDHSNEMHYGSKK